MISIKHISCQVKRNKGYICYQGQEITFMFGYELPQVGIALIPSSIILTFFCFLWKKNFQIEYENSSKNSNSSLIKKTLCDFNIPESLLIDSNKVSLTLKTDSSMSHNGYDLNFYTVLFSDCNFFNKLIIFFRFKQ